MVNRGVGRTQARRERGSRAEDSTVRYIHHDLGYRQAGDVIETATHTVTEIAADIAAVVQQHVIV